MSEIDFSSPEYLKSVGLRIPFALVATDDGYNQTNSAYWTVVDGQLAIAEDKIQSRGKRGRHITNMTGSETRGLFASGDDEYTISDNVYEPEDTRTDGYAKSPLNRFVVHAALHRIGFKSGDDVAVVTGLPLEQYRTGPDGINSSLISAKILRFQSSRPCIDAVCIERRWIARSDTTCSDFGRDPRTKLRAVSKSGSWGRSNQ